MSDQILASIAAGLSAAGLTEVDLCRRAGVHIDTIRNLRRNRQKNPDAQMHADTLAKIAAALGTTSDAMRDGSYLRQFPTIDTAGKKPLRLTTKAPDLTDARPIHELIADVPIPDVTRMPKNVPVVGVSQGGDGTGWFQFNGQIVDYVRRPPGIAHMKDVVATYVVGSSMRPWRDEGQIVYLDPNRPPRTGEYVVVEEFGDDDEPGAALLKRLISKTGRVYRLGQWHPEREDIEIEVVRVKKLWRVIDWDELLGV